MKNINISLLIFTLFLSRNKIVAQIKEFKKRQLRPSLLSDADDVDNPQSRILWNLEERDAGKFRRKEKARVKKQSNLRDLWPLGLLIIGIVLLSISIGRNFYLQHQVAEIKMNKQITLNQELPANKQATASANQSTHAIKLESPTLVEPDISPEKGLGALIVDDPMLKAPENAAVPTKEIAAIEVDQKPTHSKKKKRNVSEKKRNAIKKIALKKYNSTANSMQASKNEAVLADRDVELLSAIVAHGNPDLKRVKRHENIPPLPSIAGQ